MGNIKQLPMHRASSRKKNTAQKDNVSSLGKLEIINIGKSVCPIRLISRQKKQNFDPVYCYKSFHIGINLKNL